mgnify:FL=1|tara:strand:+ start:223 stop:582 length:360 start_codon:yes stop_codon:yes gene_type:complete
MEVIESVEDFKLLLNNNKNIVIIKLGADWCGPCIKIDPIVDAFFNEYNNQINCVKIDVDDSLDVYGYLKKMRVINGIPAILCYFSGNEGPMPDDSVLVGNENEVNLFFNRCMGYIKKLD